MAPMLSTEKNNEKNKHLSGGNRIQYQQEIVLNYISRPYANQEIIKSF